MAVPAETSRELLLSPPRSPVDGYSVSEAVSKALRVTVLYDPANRGNVTEAKEVQSAAGPLQLKVQSLEVRDAADFEAAFATLTKERPDGLYVPGGPLMNTHHAVIGVFATSIRLPSIFVRRDAVEGGGLMSYGVDYEAHYRRAAYFVDKILRGGEARRPSG